MRRVLIVAIGVLQFGCEAISFLCDLAAERLAGWRSKLRKERDDE